MQPCSREMQGIMGLTTDQQQQQQIQNPQIQVQNPHFDSPTNDDFLDQMLSLPSWPEVLPGNPKSPWADLNPQNPNNGNTTNTHHQHHHHHQKLFNIPIGETKQRNLTEDPSPENVQQYPFDESALLASRLRQHQISGNSPKTTMMLQQQLLMSRGGAAGAGGGMDRSPGSATGAACFGGESGLFPLPLTLGSGGDSDSRLLVDRSRDDVTSGDGSVQGLFSGLPGSLARTGQGVNQPHFHHPQPQSGSISNQSYSAPATGMNHAAAVGSAGGGGPGAGAPVRQKVRARRGQATDPHSIAERLRRERIAERMKALQELVPNANKTDKASMLDEIIDYVKFLQLQVKVLSMSRLGGAAAVAPLVADISSEGGGDCIQANGGGGGAGRNTNGNQTASSNDSLTVTEHQVAKLMEEDMGSAMQYLQGKGLCLMPISLASAISTATCHSRNHTNTNNHHHNPLMAAAAAASNGDGPSSPSMSVLTVQSTMGNGVAETNVKDATSVSKP